MSIFDSDDHLSNTQLVQAKTIGLLRPKYEVLREIFTSEIMSNLYFKKQRNYKETIIIFLDLESILLSVTNKYTFNKITMDGLKKHPFYLSYLILNLIGHYRHFFYVSFSMPSIFYIIWPYERYNHSVHGYNINYCSELYHKLYESSFNDESNTYRNYIKYNLDILFKAIRYIPNSYNIRDGYDLNKTQHGININPISFIEYFINNSIEQNMLIIGSNLTSDKYKSFINNKNKISILSPNGEFSKLIINQFDHFSKAQNHEKNIESFKILNNIENSYILLKSIIGIDRLDLPPASVTNSNRATSSTKIIDAILEYFEINRQFNKVTYSVIVDFYNYIIKNNLFQLDPNIFINNWCILDKDNQYAINTSNINFQIILDNLFNISNPYYLSELSNKVFSQHDLDIRLLTSGV